ncbi:MAG: hypothetical protein HRT47_03925 [Candidatus Caenarcaniphilales bacterium]|nr:hypothetical protein [Candidatus Caenarcaniphilales bacterium]
MSLPLALGISMIPSELAISPSNEEFTLLKPNEKREILEAMCKGDSFVSENHFCNFVNLGLLPHAQNCY